MIFSALPWASRNTKLWEKTKVYVYYAVTSLCEENTEEYEEEGAELKEGNCDYLASYSHE